MKQKQEPSAEFEARLFASANELLACRRERLAVCGAAAKKAKLARSRAFGVVQELVVHLSPIQVLIRTANFFALHPAAQAATLVVLTSIALIIHARPSGPLITFSDLPDFPKYNDSPARYDSQWLADRQAYEREVEYAHRKTSGGI
ncbi:MAG: hypothetical protein AABZ06_05850 [Bdellovibrionota bacterium]